MAKPPYDLRDYLFDELTTEQRSEVEAYLESSADARQELERLQITHKALLSLPDEEVPRRIAFVSDKVFEPSRAARFRQTLWAPAERFGFGAAAALLILFAGLWTVQPSLPVDHAGWQLAFGPVPEPAVAEEQTSTPPTVAGLTPEQVRAVAAALIAESDEQVRQDVTRLVSESVSRESNRSERLRQAAVEQLRRESEQAWRILRTEYEELAYTLSAEARPVGFER